MKAIQVINLMASFVILPSSLYLLFKHYGSKRSGLEDFLYKTEYYLIKIGLIIMSMGTLWHIFNIHTIQYSQVVLNIGLAIYLLWSCLYFDRMFYTPKNSIYSKKNEVIDPKDEEFPDEQD